MPNISIDSDKGISDDQTLKQLKMKEKGKDGQRKAQFCNKKKKTFFMYRFLAI